MREDHIAIHLARGWLARAQTPEAADAWLYRALESLQDSLEISGLARVEARKRKIETQEACFAHLRMHTDPRARVWFAHETATRYKRLYERTQNKNCAMLAVEVAARVASNAGLAAHELHALMGGIQAAIRTIT
jgi:hypothetical protein